MAMRSTPARRVRVDAEERLERQRFGATLQALRTARGMSQTDLAEGAGDSRSHLARVELGNAPIDVDLAVRCARYLRVDPRALLRRDVLATATAGGAQ